MAITIHPHDAEAPKLQCLSRLVFSKRVFFRPTLTSEYRERENAQPTCEERLLEAEAAYHQLQLGHSVQYTSHEGRATTYTPANSDKLYRYLLALRAECGPASSHRAGCACSACAGGRHGGRGRARGVVTY